MHPGAPFREWQPYMGVSERKHLNHHMLKNWPHSDCKFVQATQALMDIAAHREGRLYGVGRHAAVGTVNDVVLDEDGDDDEGVGRAECGDRMLRHFCAVHVLVYDTGPRTAGLPRRQRAVTGAPVPWSLAVRTRGRHAAECSVRLHVDSCAAGHGHALSVCYRKVLPDALTWRSTWLD